jgi:hypothetical protein
MKCIIQMLSDGPKKSSSNQKVGLGVCGCTSVAGSVGKSWTLVRAALLSLSLLLYSTPEMRSHEEAVIKSRTHSLGLWWWVVRLHNPPLASLQSEWRKPVSTVC